ncbi:hypothetical protein EV426DRAFT_686830 [Tirmania nivea]|nr:hypothetical protein EV426DRAFT_686830 [Tirmania nivea]
MATQPSKVSKASSGQQRRRSWRQAIEGLIRTAGVEEVVRAGQQEAVPSSPTDRDTESENSPASEHTDLDKNSASEHTDSDKELPASEPTDRDTESENSPASEHTDRDTESENSPASEHTDSDTEPNPDSPDSELTDSGKESSPEPPESEISYPHIPPHHPTTSQLRPIFSIPPPPNTRSQARKQLLAACPISDSDSDS